MIEKKVRDLNRLDRRVGRFLQIMIVVALMLVVAGLLLFAIHGASTSAPLTAPAAIPAGFAALDGVAFVTVGLYIILAMPFMILCTALAYFFWIGQRRPMFVCIVLLIMLAASYVLIVK